MTETFRTILIVDDAPEDRVSFRRLLSQNQSQTYRFLECETGGKALEIIRRERLDCVLLDFDLPDMSGAEILRELAAEFGLNAIPVVVVSGNSMIENAVASLKQGAQDFLVKGRVTITELIRAVENAIEKVALFQKQNQVEEALEISEERYRGLFNAIDEGFCVIELIFDANGKPSDYKFLTLNPAFEKQTGLTDAIGKTAKQLVPNLEQYWFEIYGKVAQTGESIRFTNESVPMSRWFDVYASKVGELDDNKIAILFTDITERKLTEIALRESEEHLRYTVELNPQIPWTADADGNIESFNERWLQMTGLTREEALGDGWIQVQHEETLPAMAAAWTHSIRTGEPYDVEHRIKFYDGSYRWMRSRALPRIDENDKILRWYGTTENIESRKIAEINRRESETRLKLAIEAGSMFAFEWNPATDIVYREINCAEILGLPPENASHDTGAGFFQKIHPDDRESFAAHIKSLKNGAEQYKISYRVLRPNDSIVWLEESGRAFFDEKGKFVKLIGITVDVTRQVLREQELREKEEFNRTVLESSQDCVKVLDSEGQLQYINTNGMRLLEIDDFEPLRNEYWQKLWSAEYQPRVLDSINAAQNGETGRFQGFSPTAKGTPKWWDVVVSPVRDASGAIVSLLSVSRDITEIKKAEQERDELYALEQTLRREAEDANRAKDEFLAILSHELRSPLNAMYGWATMLQKGVISGEDAKHAVDVIERNVRLQMTLIEDLLDVSRIITGKMKLERSDINFNSVIKSAIETNLSAAEAKNITIGTDFAVPVCEISGDSFRLQQVVGNLLTNAVKFTPEGGRVFVRLELPTNEFVRLTVTDSGCGIEAELLPYIFDRFKQADASMKRKFGGLGLGLAIVRSLVEMHDGRVRATSEGEGKGSTFTVDLPLRQARSFAAPDKATNHQAKNSNGDKLLEGIKILIVDDEPDSLEMLSFVLSEQGAIVESSTSAFAALEKISDTPPDLLVSDIGMAEMDGLDFIRQVRALNNGGSSFSFPAIALTGFAGTEDRNRALEAGFQMHLQKPVDVNKLPQTIKLLVSSDS